MKTIRYRLSLDVMGDTPVDEFLAMAHAGHATIVDFTPCGPAGGNPNVTLEAATREDLERVVNLYEPDPVENRFHKTRIVPAIGRMGS